MASSDAYGATLHVAPAGSDENDCTVIAPCASLGRAYAAAAPGDVVEVETGTYAAQRIDDDDSKDGARKPVSFQPAFGATVSFADLLNYASNVRYSGFTIDLTAGGQPDIRGGRNVVLENLHATNFYIAGARRDISVIGGDYGPFASCGGGSQVTPQWGDETDPTLMPTDILVEGVTFHDYTVPESCPDAHLDCLHIFPSVHVTVRNSTFLRCEHYGMLLNSNGVGNRDGHVIENNIFGSSSVAGFALRGGDGEDYEDLTIRNNSGDVITPQVANTLSKVRWVGNAATDFTVCREGVTYSHNVSTLSKCDATDVQAPPGFADLARDDYRLTAGAAALDAGDPADAPPDDHDGRARPAGQAPDAGALEAGAELPAPPRPKVSLDSGPLDRVTTTTATFTFSAGETDALQCDLDSAGWVPCASGITFKDLVDGPHQFQVRAVSAAGVVGDPETAAWIVDTQPPVLRLTDGPEEGSRVPSSSFAFHIEASEPVTIFCNLDNVRWFTCSDDRVTSADAVYTGIADGPHTFATYASDGTHDGEIVTRHFSVAAEPIDTIITDGPKDGGLAPASVTFTFKATEIDATFECRMDTVEWTPCTSPALYPLTSGAHHFEVRATDVGGTDATPATRDFTVDSLPPETYITGGTAEGEITAGTAVITFFSPESDATFQCRLDGPGGHDWRACGSPAGYGDLPDGAYRFWVRAVDRAGNVDPDPQSRGFTVDTTPQPETTITGGTPDGAITPGAVTFSFTGSPAGAFFECQLTGAAGSAWQTCGSPATFDSLPEGAYTFWVRARDAFGRIDPTPATRTFTIDTTEPETTITGGPGTGTTTADLVAFSFTSDDPTAHFECRLDASAWTGCTSPQAYSLPAGPHTFGVRAVDPAGNVDSFPATRSWTVKIDDHTPPETVIDGVSGDTFTFSSEPGATFECQLDAGAYTACTSPKAYPGLADGVHTFNVRATDSAGNPDLTPATRTWTVDHTPPQTVIDSATGDTFTFTSEPGATFECQLDAGAYTACTSPKAYPGLADGVHTFNVRATDSAGNPDLTPATRTWTVDHTPPQTVIDSATGDTFTFTSEPGATFECQLDAGAYTACTSPKAYPGLADGVHTFNVRATDSAGNPDPTPASKTWTVDHTPPETVINTATSDTFTFSSEPGATFQCQLDAGAYTACTSPKTYPGLADGDHTFRVRATDRAGNTDASPATRTWRIEPPPVTVDPTPTAVPRLVATPTPTPAATPAPPAPPRVSAAPTFTAKAGAKSTRFTRLEIRGVPAGATVTVTCAGRKCPRKTLTIVVSKPATVVLKPFRTTLQAGTVLTIKVDKPGMTGLVAKLAIRAGKRPVATIQCVRPGATAPSAC